MNNLNKLYDEVIRRHNSQPYHFEKKTEASKSIQAYNPICGDRFDLFLEISPQQISTIHFHGFGCAVSKASSSVLVKTLEGKSIAEAKEICDQFLRLLKNELRPDEKLLFDEFNSFSIVQEIPARYDCAALPWGEVQKFLNESI